MELLVQAPVHFNQWNIRHHPSSHTISTCHLNDFNGFIIIPLANTHCISIFKTPHIQVIGLVNKNKFLLTMNFIGIITHVEPRKFC